METKFFLFSLIFVLFSAPILAQCNSGHAKAVQTSWSSHADIVDVAADSEQFSTLVAAVKAAGLVKTLKGEGPFTVFAPTNGAFAKLPEGTVATLLRSENKATLTKILTYHVVAGKFTANDVIHAIKSNGGKFSIPTVSGGTLVASLNDGNVILEDEKGNRVLVTATDVKASNGVIHVIDSVVMPN